MRFLNLGEWLKLKIEFSVCGFELWIKKVKMDQQFEKRLAYLNFDVIFEFFRQFTIICSTPSKECLLLLILTPTVHYKWICNRQSELTIHFLKKNICFDLRMSMLNLFLKVLNFCKFLLVEYWRYCLYSLFFLFMLFNKPLVFHMRIIKYLFWGILFFTTYTEIFFKETKIHDRPVKVFNSLLRSDIKSLEKVIHNCL